MQGLNDDIFDKANFTVSLGITYLVTCRILYSMSWFSYFVPVYHTTKQIQYSIHYWTHNKKKKCKDNMC